MMRVMACSFGLAMGGLLSGCAPTVDTGCNEDADCDRGQLCEAGTAECVDQNLDLTSTENPAPSDFSTKIVPFFRGTVCTVHSVQAGASFPVYMSPCLHPCLTSSSFQFKHNWNCIGSSCDAYALMWVSAEGAACPADAFGKFDRSQCDYSTEVAFSINPVYDDGRAIEGQMRLEIPFLSNADASQIAADPDNAGLRDNTIQKYPQEMGRIPGGMDISLLSSNPPPPAECGESGAACDCFDVGF